MFPIEKAVWELLKDNIVYNDSQVISLVRRLTSNDETPCITIQQASEVQISREILPGKSEIIQTKNNVEVWINIWANTEEQRQSLLLQVETRIFQALANHYTTCDNYDDENCKYLNETCQALTITNGRTTKNQCPYPNENQYISWFKKHHIIKPTFTISGKQDMDELDTHQPILRTIIKLDMDYYRNYDLGGHQLTDIILDEELL